MRIAFLNPWLKSAEYQAFKSLQVAAARLGHELLHCSNSDELESTIPDFVLAAASTQPKLTRFPTYGVIHEPRDRFLANKEYFHNLLSYDGYLTISDTLATFLKHLLYGTRRPANIGFFYNSCQANSADPDFASRLRAGKVKLTYFGTNWNFRGVNWDKRRPNFFKLLSESDDVEIYGPEESWRDINPKSYKGLLPFDGFSVQEKYKQNGIGLVLLSDKHLVDDVISNRIFEITSVGAIPICCRMAWLERNFGDNVYYVDQQCPDRELVEQVLALVQSVKSHPEDALERAQRAYQIFQDRFSAEQLLQNAINYHKENWKIRVAAAHPVSKASDSPLISVIIRCGGRPIETLRRALNSLAQQTFGRFDVILIRYQERDLGGIIAEFSNAFETIRVFDCLRGNRSKTLWCGLNNIKGDYFAILDDDDEVLPNHFECLFPSSSDYPKDSYFAYTGSIRVYLEPKETAQGNLERRFIYTFGISECKRFFDQSGFFTSNSFVASSSLLDAGLLIDPQFNVGEDSYLILSLLAKSQARFNFRATAVMYENKDSSNFLTDPNRGDDVLNTYLRLLSCYARTPQIIDAHDVLRQQNETMLFPKLNDVEETEGTTIYHVKNFPLSRIDKAYRQVAPFSVDTGKLVVSEGSVLTDVLRLTMSVDAPRKPWAYAVQFSLVISQLRNPYLVEIDCNILKGTFGFGVLNKSANDFLYRIAVPASSNRILIHLPVEDATAIGPIVIQNWDLGLEARAKVNSISLFSEAAVNIDAGAVSVPGGRRMKPWDGKTHQSQRAELFDELDCMPMLTIGNAGSHGPLPQIGGGAIHARSGIAGTLAYGPYISLQPGRYEVTFEFYVDHAKRGAAFSVDIATDKGKRILARRRIKVDPRRPRRDHPPDEQPAPLTYLLNFDVKPGSVRRACEPIEFRVWSPGTIEFCLAALRVRQTATLALN